MGHARIIGEFIHRRELLIYVGLDEKKSLCVRLFDTTYYILLILLFLDENLFM